MRPLLTTAIVILLQGACRQGEPAPPSPKATPSATPKAKTASPPTTGRTKAATPAARPRSLVVRYRLRGQKLTDKAFARWLAGLPSPPEGPASLDVRDNRLTAAAITAIAKSSLGYPINLMLSNNPLGDRAARALAQGKGRFNSISVLYLADTKITGRGVSVLMDEGSALSYLEDLELSNNPVGDAGVLALAASPRAKSLTALYLNNIRMTDRGAQALARSPNLGRLRTLEVQGNRLTPAGVKALRESPGLAGCKTYVGDKGQ